MIERDVPPFISTTSPNTHLYPRVSVTWGRQAYAPDGRALRMGARYEYSLGRTPDGGLHAEMCMEISEVAWIGRPRQRADVSTCPLAIKEMALAALRRQQVRRYDGYSYVLA